MAASAVPAQLQPGMRRGTRAAMAVLNIIYVCAAPVFWFFWSQRRQFELPAWAEQAAGFAAGVLPVLVFLAAWLSAAVLFSRGLRQDGGRAFNALGGLGLLAAASGMLALAAAGLDS
ncbi:hypothetical protein LJ754_06255 [Arthrobacter sp. zg-Y40]|uniref:hypothetical protein n=1 Tax=unclassified Arthrobacter TaxID=235627 RepID=UPI001D1447E3|nr:MULTISPECIES: hypothetical protein [unclassified Arthrobacter]MCC3278761.1 hypothetical protein [Arthrobacter sp. zg-Y40]MDK1326165.1 hypothetical protein [Arthrobacter sp. zg-Y1143]